MRHKLCLAHPPSPDASKITQFGLVLSAIEVLQRNWDIGIVLTHRCSKASEMASMHRRIAKSIFISNTIRISGIVLSDTIRPTRIAILEFLDNTKGTFIDTICQKLDKSFSTIYEHLIDMQQEGLVKHEKDKSEGRSIWFRTEAGDLLLDAVKKGRAEGGDARC